MESLCKGGYANCLIRTFSNGNNVIEKIAKYLILSLLGLSALTFVTVLILDDELIESTTGPAAETLLGIKHGTIDTVSGKSETFVYWFRTKINDIMNFSPTNRVPRVVMRVPPPPEDVQTSPGSSTDDTRTGDTTAENTSAQPADPAGAQMPLGDQPITPAQPEGSMNDAANTAAMTQNAMPASPPPEAPAPESIPESTSESAPMTSAMGHGTPAMEGAPPPMPVTDVSQQPLTTEPATPTEQAALPDAAAGAPPPPPPAAEEQRPGEADYQQGLKYYNGDGVEQNFGKAAQYFLRAGNAGHVGAQYNLGIMNYTGQTGGQDFANAAKWFERAAGAGHTQAQYNLGFLYYEGKGVQQNLKTAFDWINRAAEQGYPKAIKARDAFKQAMPEMFPAGSSAPAQ